MITLKTTLTLASSALLLSLALPSVAATRKLSDEDYSDIIKTIMVKNQVVTKKSQVSQIVLDYTVAALADDITNINNDANLIFDRAVQFNVDLMDSQSQFRSYTCNLTVRIKGKDDFSGSRLSGCEFHARGLDMLNY